MKNESNFLDELICSPLSNGKLWVLRKNFKYQTIRGEIINVPEGFFTDFASIPWLFRWFIPKWGKYGEASVIHDWLYWNQSDDFDRNKSDWIFKEAMGFSNVNRFKKFIIYQAVHIFGKCPWEKNTKKKINGFDHFIELSTKTVTIKKLYK